MKAIRLLILAGLLTALFPLNALANPGQACVIDPESGMLVPENGSGACFDDNGFIILIFAEGEGVVFAGNGPGDDNQFRHLNPNGKGRFHAVVEASFLQACTWASVESGGCIPFGGDESFFGSGSVKLNADVAPTGEFDCPFTARVTGSGTDSFGNVIELRAALTQVPDPDFGCRATVVSVDIEPVVD